MVVCALLLFPASALLAQLTYSTNNGAITITGYSGDAGNLDIPESIGGLPVKAVVTNAFASQERLSSVTIPKSVTSIGKGAFSSPGQPSLRWLLTAIVSRERIVGSGRKRPE